MLCASGTGSLRHPYNPRRTRRPVESTANGESAQEMMGSRPIAQSRSLSLEPLPPHGSRHQRRMSDSGVVNPLLLGLHSVSRFDLLTC